MIPLNQPKKYNINPDPSKRSKGEILDNFWRKDREGNYLLDVENFEERDVLHMGNIDFQNCRFEITNKDLRLCTCTIHRAEGFSHGFKLHPPHLWDIRDGVLYKKLHGKFVKFIPQPVDRLDAANNR